ncbi:uncharacterized oxidoreductase TM_0325-like [Sitodiplosis mosellana]|uniref:uncharacterized oxidoreductase TM_0325-like n=1 Tax=Sitodiplosis mosellana TaxID=263140 RepID=UPI00244477D5|nr:uncharacterized oxidoreductase TM_0325-like [Sitodiplosis mosellana]
MSFSKKVVLITGASSGIGAGAAIHLAELGAKVSIVGRNEKRLNEVAEEIKSAGSPAPLLIVADVTKDAKRIVNETIKKFGQLDVLVNNAGFAKPDSVSTANLSQFDSIFDTNIRSVITLTKLCVPHLEKTKGNVVNISSVAGLKATPNFLSYCMSKAALDQFTKCSALDLAPKGIRVNSVNPAAIRTGFIEVCMGAQKEDATKMYDGIGSIYPVGRVGEVADTSAAIAFLADDKTASFLTGILLPVDGGSLVAGTNSASKLR